MSIRRILSSKFPVTISQGKKKFIKESFFSASRKIGEEEFNYVNEKIHDKINATSNSGTKWVQELGMCYGVLHTALSIRKNAGKNKLSESTYKLLGTAIFYFINPFDIIPDFTPGIGYADDLLVLITCLKAIPKNELDFILQLSDNYEIK